ncbi:MAG: phosphatidylglycerophosphatase A [Arsenophonus sp. ER-BJ3-MAG3]
MNCKKSFLMFLNSWYLLSTGFGSGLSPIIPGTIGSLFCIPFWLLMYWLLPIWLCWLIILFSFFIGIFICKMISFDMQVHDHGSIVWDEFVGMWITLMFIPIINWQWILITFLLFRFLDILKPWPIYWFDRKISGGLGIMIDDIIVAISSIIIISILTYYLPILYYIK